MKKKLIVLVSGMMILAGCTPVRFYSDPGLSKQTGLKFYTVKPYLQVEREPESGRIVKSTVLYLPDLANPQYMAVKNGPGAAKVDLKLSDGILNTFGYEYEQMLPETVESLASLLSKSAGAIEDLNNLKSIPGLKATPNTIELYEIVITNEKTFFKEVTPIKNNQ